MFLGVNVWEGLFPPRLLQGHSPIGEPQCMALVERRAGFGEGLVNDSEPSHGNKKPRSWRGWSDKLNSENIVGLGLI